MSPPADTPRADLHPARILRLWWPLALSWLLMAADNQVLTAWVARMPEPEVNLAAWGSIVFPIALVVEGPIIMLLAASTALVRDAASYRKLYRFMMAAGAGLTAVHLLVAFTPLYDVVARDVLGAPAEVLEPGRLGLRLMTPWTWAIAHRRFHQGILIRRERSRAIVVGTGVRLATVTVVLALGYAHGGFPGIAVGSAAISAGVLAEMGFVARAVRPVLRDHVLPAPPAPEPLTRGSFLRFYVPLAITPSLTLMIQPVAAWAINHMPRALLSQAAWTPVYSFVFLARGMGFAFNEVVVALLGEPGAARVLRRFSLVLAAATSGGLAVLALTPLSTLWFGSVAGLEGDLLGLARTGILVAVLMPAYAVLQSLYTGALVHAERTRGVTEAVVLYAATAAGLLSLGAWLDPTAGLYVGLVSLTVAGVLQTVWLFVRGRSNLRA